MAVSDVSICNLASVYMGVEEITSLTDDSAEAEAYNRVFTHLRDAEQKAHPWLFGIKRVSLSADTEAPEFGYARRFRLPSDYLRTLTIGDSYVYSETIGLVYRDYYLGDPDEAPFQIENGFILTDFSAPLKLRYSALITDPTLFDPLFVEVLARRIVVSTIRAITNCSANREELEQKKYMKALSTARRENAIERPPRKKATGSMLTSRL